MVIIGQNGVFLNVKFLLQEIILFINNVLSCVLGEPKSLIFFAIYCIVIMCNEFLGELK